MKLTKLFEQEEQLNEGLRFGQKERSLVQKESRNIRVGIEYEFHVNEEFDEEPSEAYDEAVYEKAAELQEEHIQETKETWMEEYADSEMGDRQIEDFTASARSLRDSYQSVKTGIDALADMRDDVENAIGEYVPGEFDDEDDENGEGRYKGFEDQDAFETVEQFFSAVDGLTGDFEEMRDYGQEVQGYDWYSENVSTIFDDDVDFDDIVTELEAIVDFANSSPHEINSEDNVSEIPADIPEFADLISAFDDLDEFPGDDGDWDQKARNSFEEYSEDAWDDFGKESALGFDPDDGVQDQFYDAARDEVDPSDYDDGETAVNYVKEQIEDYDIHESQIQHITTDASVDNGVEVITEPLELMESHEVMEQMFEMIDDIGSTSGSTGMHVNMSYRGIRFNESTFHPAKLVMLMDEKYMKTKFDIRSTYAPEIWKNITPQHMIEYANTQNSTELLKHFEDNFIDDQKYRTISFKNVFDDMLDKTKRIEFRFFGGNNYEQDYDKMVYEIDRAAYMMMVAFAPEFGHKEYFKKVLKTLNRASKRYFGMDFLTFAKNFKAIPSGVKTDLVNTEYDTPNMISALQLHLLHTKPFRKYADKWLKMTYGPDLEAGLNNRYNTKDVQQALANIVFNRPGQRDPRP